ncbi:MAG: putative motility protein [Candidatus Brocadia sp.]|nr:putative motility protein [Candidatus Brocadia sp.]
MIGNITPKMSVDNNIEMVKKAMDFMKMQGETVLKLIEEQKQANESFSNPEGVGKNVDVYA